MSFFANKGYGVVWGNLDTFILLTSKYLLSVLYSIERWATPNSAQHFRPLSRRARTDLLPTESPYFISVCHLYPAEWTKGSITWETVVKKKNLNKIGGPKQVLYSLYSQKADVQQEFCANTWIFLRQKPFFFFHVHKLSHISYFSQSLFGYFSPLHIYKDPNFSLAFKKQIVSFQLESDIWLLLLGNPPPF